MVFFKRRKSTPPGTPPPHNLDFIDTDTETVAAGSGSGGTSSVGVGVGEESFGKTMENPVYDTQSHSSVLCRYYGSVWPHVLPYCLFNVMLTGLAQYLKHGVGIDLTFPSNGHTFMSVVLAFLIVSRSSAAYQRFMEARHDLEDLYRSSKELVHYLAVFSAHEQGPQAKEWRSEVAYRTILLLRVTMAALEHVSSQINTWDVPELAAGERRHVKKNLILDPKDAISPEPAVGRKRPVDGSSGFSAFGAASSASSPSPSVPGKGHRRRSSRSSRGSIVGGFGSNNRRVSVSNMTRWAHGPRSLRDENFRAPILLAYKLRAAIVSHKAGRLEGGRLHVNQEREMLMFVSQYMTAYHGLRKVITTPYVFPFVQMTRMFLFFWVFTLPFALVTDIDDTPQCMIIVFFITYGFLGLEVVSMELDDPFGDDPNDFDNLAMAQMIFEDIYITINSVDGQLYAQQLRNRITDRREADTPLGHFRKESADIYYNQLQIDTISAVATHYNMSSKPAPWAF